MKKANKKENIETSEQALVAASHSAYSLKKILHGE
jgi:hypothetical protein